MSSRHYGIGTPIVRHPDVVATWVSNAPTSVLIGHAGEPQPFEQGLVPRDVGARMHPLPDRGDGPDVAYGGIEIGVRDLRTRQLSLEPLSRAVFSAWGSA